MVVSSLTRTLPDSNVMPLLLPAKGARVVKLSGRPWKTPTSHQYPDESQPKAQQLAE